MSLLSRTVVRVVEVLTKHGPRTQLLLSNDTVLELTDQEIALYFPHAAIPAKVKDIT